MAIEFLQETLAGAGVSGRFAAEASGQLLKLLGPLRQLIERAIMHDAQPALDQAQKVVAGLQRGMFLGSEKAGLLGGIQGSPGARIAQRRQGASIFEAEKLHDELDVDDAAEAALDVALAAGGLDALA